MRALLRSVIFIIISNSAMSTFMFIVSYTPASERREGTYYFSFSELFIFHFVYQSVPVVIIAILFIFLDIVKKNRKMNTFTIKIIMTYFFIALFIYSLYFIPFFSLHFIVFGLFISSLAAIIFVSTHIALHFLFNLLSKPFTNKNV